MPTRPLLIHRRKIEDSLRQVTGRHAFLFAAACTERAWPVYERASADKPWAMRPVLRGSLDAVWDWLIGPGERPRLAEQCERAVFDQNSDAEEDNGAFHVANAFYGLAAIVEEDQPHHGAQAAVGNLDLLDAFLYDYLDLTNSPANDLVVDAHELMQREMQRQLDDIRALSQPFAPDLVQTIRGRARGQSVLGEHWYRP